MSARRRRRADIANLASMECLSRRRQLLEEAHVQGAHHFVGEGAISTGALAAAPLRAHVASEFFRDAAVDKGRRKVEEAKAKAAPKGAKDKDCFARVEAVGLTLLLA
eukprot:9178331-Pyramimonas_sp.AAC.1